MTLPYYLEEQFIEVNLEVTNICNFDCWFCPRSAMTRKQGMMEFSDFKNIILGLEKAKFLKEVAIAGIGEPTLHPKLNEMIAFIKENSSLKVVLTTNASKLNNDEFIENLLRSGVDKITISLRITDPVKNCSSIPNSLDYAKYMEGILNLVRIKHNSNYASEIEIAFLKETIYSKYILGMQPEEYIDSNRLNGFLESLSEITGKNLPSYETFTGTLKSRLSNVDRIELSDGIHVRFDSLSSWTTVYEKFEAGGVCYPAKYGSCLGMHSHFAVYWNGDVSTCCADFNVQNRLGNIIEERDILKILNTEESLRYAEALKKNRMPTKTCQICRGGKSRKEKWANMIGTMLYVK
jgi:radical SAM protein with 4Fe4S-binding SPASM domain